MIRAFSGARTALVGTDGAADSPTSRPGRSPAAAPRSDRWPSSGEDDRSSGTPTRSAAGSPSINREVTRPRWEERRIERERGLLGDDTTVVVVRRKQG